MTPSPDRLNDLGKRFEVITFHSQPILPEERNDPLLELNRAVHRVHIHRARRTLRADLAAVEEVPRALEDVSMILVLRYLERRLYMPAVRRSRQLVAMDGH